MQCDTYKLTREVYTEFFVVGSFFLGGGGIAEDKLSETGIYIFQPCASKYMLKIF